MSGGAKLGPHSVPGLQTSPLLCPTPEHFYSPMSFRIPPFCNFVMERPNHRDCVPETMWYHVIRCLRRPTLTCLIRSIIKQLHSDWQSFQDSKTSLVQASWPLTTIPLTEVSYMLLNQEPWRYLTARDSVASTLGCPAFRAVQCNEGKMAISLQKIITVIEELVIKMTTLWKPVPHEWNQSVY